MQFLNELLKKEFNLTIMDYSKLWKKELLNKTKKANSLLQELNVTKISFNDNEFSIIYNHIYYNDLKDVLDQFKNIKDLKLPNKN